MRYIEMSAMATSLRNRKNWTRLRKFTQIPSIWWKDRENRSSWYWDSFAHSKKEEITEGKIYSPVGRSAERAKLLSRQASWWMRYFIISLWVIVIEFWKQVNMWEN